VLLAELRLALKGRRWWWFAVLAGLNVAALAVPDVLPNAGGPPLSGATVRGYLLAAAWFWPIAVWSAMGCRARQHNTRPIVFSVPRPVGRPLAAAWLAGLCVTAVAGSGYALRLVFAGQGPALAAWAAGALLIPSLALALGVWTGSRRAFEVVYTFLWYLGPVNQVAALDYVGVTAGALAGRFWRYHLLASVLLLALAALGRTRQVRQL
jgi:hypothetical protein